MMEADEAGTLERLKVNRSRVFDPCLAAHGGRLVKLIGDGALVDFRSVIAAVNCALAVQAATLAPRLIAPWDGASSTASASIWATSLSKATISTAKASMSQRGYGNAPGRRITLSAVVRGRVAGKVASASMISATIRSRAFSARCTSSSCARRLAPQSKAQGGRAPRRSDLVLHSPI